MQLYSHNISDFKTFTFAAENSLRTGLNIQQQSYTLRL
jgi:hypothetical protein